MSDEPSRRDPFEEAAESFLQRLRRGERPALSEFAARYPELAGEIREFFPALVMMEQVGSLPTDGPRPAGQPPRLGDYRILREVGHGGMGVVYEAVQESLGRHVALKVLPVAHGTNATRLERFRREARAAAALHHSNIVPVFGVGEDQGIHYFAMQYIAGPSLAVVLREVKELRAPPGLSAGLTDTPVPGRETAALLDGSTEVVLGSAYFRGVARLGVQAARALEYAHQQGVLHRDVKPANLLLDAHGAVWLSDFGLAKLDSADELTGTGDVVGTLRYLPPERFAGQADARGDVYALALTLYEMACLRPAFDAADRLELVEQIKQGVTVRPRQVEPAVPRDLETIILKGCDREPNRRYQSAGELADDLEAFLADRPIQARRLASWQRLARWARRKPAVAALSALLLLTVLFALAGALWGWDHSARQWAAEKEVREEKEEALEEKGIALGEKERALAEKELALEEAKSRLYDRNIALADLHWRDNRVAQAEHLLDECPAERRGWEWHLLKRRCRARLLAVKMTDPLHVRFSRDGRRLALIGFTFKRVPGGQFETGVEVRDARTGKLERSFAIPGQPTGISTTAEPLLVATQTATRGLVANQSLVSDGWTGRPLRTLPLASAHVFSPDGKHVGGTLGNRGPFRVWEVGTGNLVRTVELPGPTAIIRGLSADGKHLLVSVPQGKASERVQILDAQTGQPAGRLAQETSAATGVFNPAGTALATWGVGCSLRLCHPITGVTKRTLAGVSLRFRAVAFGPASRLASGGDDGVVIVWDTAAGRELFRFHGHAAGVVDLAFDAEGKRLVSCDRDGGVRVWDVTAGQDTSVRDCLSLGALAELSPDGRRVARCPSQSELRIQDAATLTDLVGPIALDRTGASRFTFSPSGDRLAAKLHVNSVVQVWDTRTGQAVKSVSIKRQPLAAMALIQEGRLACANGRGGIDLWDVDAGRLWRTLPGEEPLSGTLGFAPQGRRIAAVGREQRSLCLWEEDGGACRVLALDGPASSVAFHPDGERLAIGFQDGSIQLRDCTTFRLIRQYRRHESAVAGLAFHRDGRRLASAGVGSVKIWDVHGGQDLLELPLPDRSSLPQQVVFVRDELLVTVRSPWPQLVRWDGTPGTRP